MLYTNHIQVSQPEVENTSSGFSEATSGFREFCHVTNSYLMQYNLFGSDQTLIRMFEYVADHIESVYTPNEKYIRTVTVILAKCNEALAIERFMFNPHLIRCKQTLEFIITVPNFRTN
jgi:hypothetical protein